MRRYWAISGPDENGNWCDEMDEIAETPAAVAEESSAVVAHTLDHVWTAVEGLRTDIATLSGRVDALHTPHELEPETAAESEPETSEELDIIEPEEMPRERKAKPRRIRRI